MPARLSKLFSYTSSVKERAALAETEANHDITSAPPPYTASPNNFDADNALSPPDITAGFNNLHIRLDKQERIPGVQECIAHLKLLECFYRLQQKIGSTDGLYGIQNSTVLFTGLPDDSVAELIRKLGEKRWTIYVARAVDRFEIWSKQRFPVVGRPTISDILAAGREGYLTTEAVTTSALSARAKALTKDDMPPIDVLLVWHAFMLNPRAYFEDCLRHGRMHMWQHNFPWELVAQSVDSETFIYTSNEASMAAFAGLTHYPWDINDGQCLKHYICHKCDMVNFTHRTVVDTAPISASNLEQAKGMVDHMLSSGTGHSDQNFSTECENPECRSMIDHESLKVGKFSRDLRELYSNNYPMPGTLFAKKGIISHTKDGQAARVLVNTNRFFRQDHRNESVIPASTTTATTMADVRKGIELRLKDRRIMRDVPDSEYRAFGPDERMALRRLMSRYWNNSSPFSIDLVGAVVRQSSFTEKMHNIDWLHSPALYSTIPRLTIKYQRFVAMARRVSHMVVPTLDVDLAWHTHQLSPRSYCHYTIEETDEFMDHDDKVAEVRLNNAFALTLKHYQRQYGEPYSECTCWYCEAVRESHTSSISRLFNNNEFQQPHPVNTEPNKSVHISAHNAVRPRGDVSYDLTVKRQIRKLEDTYTMACRRARKKGREPPKRNDYYYSDAYGYPVYMPAYIPLMAPMPCTPAYYPVGGCMTVTTGAYGNCCTGTCGGGASAIGGCGNSGGGCGNSAGCAGAGGGACGGGGGGSCGGGGGGGGCGGGGG